MKVIVGMSGGVDSSVTALLLKEQGYQVEGLFMKNWDEDDGTDYCTAIEDLADAQAVADKIGIKLHSVNFAAEYWDNVFEHFLAEYKAGRTPNPDILCNREIKFKVFIQYAERLGADYIATGHYARTSTVNGHTELLKGLDNNKDQTYFLAAVGEAEFAKTLFPVGELEKSEVRDIATKMGLKTHDKKDSTGICFIGERRFTDFLSTYLPAQPGDIITPSGDVIGKHAGLMYHTIGQRQGLGIGGVKGAPDAPWYVVKKKLDTNQLVVDQGKHSPYLYADRCWLSDINLINADDIGIDGLACMIKVRYRQPDQGCRLFVDGDLIRVEFDEPQRAVTLGQFGVLYDGERCMGGGVISRTEGAADAL